MSIITAIRSFITPTKYYKNQNVTVTKKLLPNGSTSIKAYSKEGKLLKSVTKQPVNEYTHDSCKGNTLKRGHFTTAKDYVAGTETNVDKYERIYEQPLYDAFHPTKTIVDAGGSIKYFHKFKKNINGNYIDSFNMTTNKNGSSGIKMCYNGTGKPVSTIKYNFQKG